MRAVPMMCAVEAMPAERAPGPLASVSVATGRTNEVSAPGAAWQRAASCGPKYAEEAISKRCAEWVMRGTGKPLDVPDVGVPGRRGWRAGACPRPPSRGRRRGGG